MNESIKEKDELINMLNLIISEKINMLEGVRNVVHLRHNIDLTDKEIFNYFVAIDSETDHIPLGKVREHWNKDSLENIDVEMNEYIEDSIEDTKRVCVELIELISFKS